MSNLRTTLYSDRIMKVAECDHRQALILENAMRWHVGGANPGTLDHLSADEFDGTLRWVQHELEKDPDVQASMEREAEAEGLVPAKCG